MPITTLTVVKTYLVVPTTKFILTKVGVLCFTQTIRPLSSWATVDEEIASLLKTVNQDRAYITPFYGIPITAGIAFWSVCKLCPFGALNNVLFTIAGKQFAIAKIVSDIPYLGTALMALKWGWSCTKLGEDIPLSEDLIHMNKRTKLKMFFVRRIMGRLCDDDKSFLREGGEGLFTKDAARKYLRSLIEQSVNNGLHYAPKSYDPINHLFSS